MTLTTYILSIVSFYEPLYKVTYRFNVSHITSEFSAMTEELWKHALAFLDKHGSKAGEHMDELYEFADKTGILERHKQLLARPGHETQVGGDKM